MAAITLSTESTPTQPPFQAPYIMPMPYLGVPGSPFFDGANISEFLERFENMCDDYRILISEKIRRLALLRNVYRPAGQVSNKIFRAGLGQDLYKPQDEI